MNVRAQLIGGKLIFNPIRFSQFAAKYEGKWVTIEAEIPERSMSQLRMYRAWLNNVADHSGNDPEELHEFLLDRCAPRVVVTIRGNEGKKSVEIERTKRTSGGTSLSMTKEEMGTFMERCVVLTGYPLPTQEELIAMGYLPN
jgi:hypothetical protein